jgi:hypothetical protein
VPVTGTEIITSGVVASLKMTCAVVLMKAKTSSLFCRTDLTLLSPSDKINQNGERQMFDNLEYCHDFFGRDSVTYIKDGNQVVGIVIWINMNRHTNVVNVF